MKNNEVIRIQNRIHRLRADLKAQELNAFKAATTQKILQTEIDFSERELAAAEKDAIKDEEAQKDSNKKSPLENVIHTPAKAPFTPDEQATIRNMVPAPQK